MNGNKKLELLDASVAQTFGLPAEDTSVEAILALDQYRGWERAALHRHIACAIQAGAYREAEPVGTAAPTSAATRRANSTAAPKEPRGEVTHGE